MLSAAASLGMILLWDVDGGLTQIDKYLYSSEDYIKVNIMLENDGCFFARGAPLRALLTWFPCKKYLNL